LVSSPKTKRKPKKCSRPMSPPRSRKSPA
jgi:hypothetical protein